MQIASRDEEVQKLQTELEKMEHRYFGNVDEVMKLSLQLLITTVLSFTVLMLSTLLLTFCLVMCGVW